MNPWIAQLIGEPIMMQPEALRRLVETLAAIPDHHEGFFGGEDAQDNRAELDVRDGVAHIPIHGTIMKTVPAIYRWFGIPATSTEETGELLTRAVESEDVKAIQLDIESPGGVVKGVDELAGAIRTARDSKPVTAHATDLMASAAYWLGAQAESISANAMGTIGSIGVYTVLGDYSGLHEKAGVKVHVVATSELKGAGAYGAPITDHQLADVQRLIDAYGDRFIDAVVQGRGVDEDTAREWATGQVWLADEAQQMGLIDSIQTAEAAHTTAMDSPAPRGANTGAIGMTTEEQLRAELAEANKAKEAAEKAAAVAAEKIEAQAAEIGEAKKEAEEKAEQIKAQTEANRTRLVKQAQEDGKISPAMLAHFQKIAAGYGDDLEGLAEMFKTLPKAIHDEPVGDTPEENVEEQGYELTEEDKAAAKLFKLSAEDYRKFLDVNGNVKPEEVQ